VEPKDAFLDPVGQSIKIRLINHVIQKSKKPPKDIEAAVERTANIVAVTREATIEALKGEVEVLGFKSATGDNIPPMFFAGVLHALEVIQGNGSMIGIVDDEDYR
jgi:CBS-domain-containing membrane protein